MSQQQVADTPTEAAAAPTPSSPGEETRGSPLRRFFATYRPVLVLMVVAAAAEGAYAAINMLALQVFVDEVLNLTAYLGLILGTFLAVEAVMKSVMGALADRYGRWKFLGAAPVVSGCTALLMVALGAAARHYLRPAAGSAVEYHSALQILLVLLPLLLIRALDGVAAAAFWPTMFATNYDNAPRHRRASSMSFMTVAYMVGVALGPPLAGWANDKSPLADRSRPVVTEVRIVQPDSPPARGVPFLHGPLTAVDPATRSLTVAGETVTIDERARILRDDAPATFADLAPGQEVRLRAARNKAAAFWVISILFFITAFLALTLVPRRAPVRPERAGEHDAPLRLSDLTIALRQAPSLVVTAAVVFIAVGALAGTAPLYAKEIFSLSDSEYGNLFLVPAVVIGLLTLPIGLLSDWWGRARSVHVGIATAFLALSLMAAVAILPGLHPFRNQFILAGLATLLGIGFVMGLPAWLATVADFAGEERRASMIGAVATSEGFGAFVGMSVGPVLFDLRDRIPFMVHAPMLVAAASLGVGLGIALWTIRPQLPPPPRSPEPEKGLVEIAEVIGGQTRPDLHLGEPPPVPPAPAPPAPAPPAADPKPEPERGD
jgi:MFS family permease